MKNNKLKAGYSVQIGRENLFILEEWLHGKPSGSPILIPHLKKPKKLSKALSSFLKSEKFINNKKEG